MIQRVQYGSSVYRGSRRGTHLTAAQLEAKQALRSIERRRSAARSGQARLNRRRLVEQQRPVLR